MLKNYENKQQTQGLFIKEQADNNKLASPAPVILGLVPRILLQQGSNLVNKLALLLHKSLLREDSRNKSENDWCQGGGVSTFSQSGRSMIEMLGVLAIIAVLSVGGIAGYGKAMRMWKSNQQKEQLSQIFATAIRLRYDLSHDKSYNIDKGGNNPIASVFAAIDEVPAGLTYENERMYDKDGNYYSIEYGLRCWWENGKGKVCSFQFIIGVNLIKIQSSLTPSSEDLCVNTIEIAKENANDVEGITTFLGKEQGSGYYQNNIFLRDYFKQATPSQMLEKCRTCKNHSYCSVSVYLKSH